DPARCAFVMDHMAPAHNASYARMQQMVRDFCREQGIRVYEVGEGISHPVLIEHGCFGPGDLVVGTDSHTCTNGAVNVFSTGVGSSDWAAAMASGKMWFKVPETVRFELRGRLPKGVYSKDLVLYLIGKMGADGLTYKSAEFAGEAIESLSVQARFTISNMAIEMGAKVGLMQADARVGEWFARRTDRRFEPVDPDPDARYSHVLVMDVSRLEPQVAKPHRVDNVFPLSEAEGTPIQQALIGTCTNGRLEDLREAAAILRGRRVHEGVRLLVNPASREALVEGMRDGTIPALIEAGALLNPPGCGVCPGITGGIPADGENVISASNRNFRGRMGNPDASIFLASPATVAASALEGRIADPRRYL
ncbi:MAG: 3-isopropylmalate dehydratase large subunit, partial [Nitrospinota bacterium]